MAPDTAHRDGTIAALDGVRAVAILAVLAHHGSYGFIKGGFLGVDLFFVLSGFLITRLLVQEWHRNGRIALSGFYARRALRIFPPLIAALVLAQALGRFDWQQGAAPILGFYANYVDHLRLGTMIHAWSLAVEEQFYIVWPVLFIAAFRYGGPRAALALAIGVFVAALGLRVQGVASGLGQDVLYRHVLFRADSLAAGCVLALLDRRHWRLPATATGLGFLAILAPLCLLATNSHPLMLSVGFSLFAVLSGLLIAALAGGASTSLGVRFASHPVLAWIGRRSYGIYLYHVPIFVATEALREPGNLVNFALVTALRLAATAVIAEVSWRLIEAPALRLKRHFYAAGSAVAPTAPQPVAASVTG